MPHPESAEKSNAADSETFEAKLTGLCLAFQKTVKTLRGPDGCPWDREQNFETLRPFMIEEAYEAVAASTALSQGKPGSHMQFCDELGDVLLQVFLNAAIAEEMGLFTVADVFTCINEKMIRRHPHVFNRSASGARTVDEVLTQWADIKKTEAGAAPEKSKSLLAKATKKKTLPTLAYGCEISKRSLAIGFSWSELPDIFKDLESEVRELSEEIFAQAPDIAKITDEAGDVVYALCNVVTFLRERFPEAKGLDLDIAARGSFDKFLTRFTEMERILAERGVTLTEEHARSLSLDAWNELWKLAKGRLAKSGTP